MLEQVCGKNDMKLLDDAPESLWAYLADYDEQANAPSDDYDVDISHAEALREIVAGRFTGGVTGSRYGWAFECFCRALGERLDNTGFIPCRTEWYFTLDDVMAENQVPLKFTDLIFRIPVPIPEADDWPAVGHWADHDYAAADRLATVLPGIGDAEIALALQSALGWLRSGADHPGSLIVGFHG
jgi:hypothetical protein